MADAVANPKVEQQRLLMQIAAQRSTIERQKLEIMEMADRRKRNEDNIVAAEVAIAEMEKQRLQLSKTHGELTAQVFKEMSDHIGREV